MTRIKIENKTEKLYAPVIFMLLALLPEYVAPVITLIIGIRFVCKKAKSKATVFFGSIGMAISLFFVWMIIASFYSPYIVSSLASLVLWLVMFGGYLYFLGNLKTENDIRTTMFYGAISAGIAGFIGVVQMVIYHFGNRIYDGMSKLFNPFWRILDLGLAKIVSFLPASLTSHLPSTTFKTFETRACSTLSNPIFFASFLCMMIPFAAYAFLFMKERKRRIVGLICFVLAIGGIVCSYSRGPYIALVLVLTVLFFYGSKNILKLLGVEATVLAGALVFAGGFVKRLLTLGNGTDISVNTRTEIWKAVFEIGKERPVFGYGTGFNNVREILHNDYGIMQPHAHNIVFEVWLENGAIGVILLLFIFAVCIINLIKMFRTGGTARTFAVTLCASVIGFFTCGMTDCLFYGLKPLQYLMMIFGIIGASSYLFSGQEKQRLLPEKWTEKIKILKIF